MMNTNIRITKGCKALGIDKGTRAVLVDVKEMGAEYTHFVRITIKFNSRTVALWVRHKNRLGDSTVRAHNGDPTKNVEFQRV